MQQADGAWRDANNRHQQAVASALRLEKNLAAARDKEANLSKLVAETAFTRAQAAAAVATVEGVSVSSAAMEDKKPFDVVWDEDLFNNLDQLERE
eukprot:3631379-Pyramimonas_sp.AAC.1